MKSDEAMTEQSASCMAGLQLAGMSDEQKVEVNTQLKSNLKKQINKTVKAAVVSVQYGERAEAMCRGPSSRPAITYNHGTRAHKNIVGGIWHVSHGQGRRLGDCGRVQ